VACGDGDASIVVRVNGASSPWFEPDLALVASSPRVGGVMLRRPTATRRGMRSTESRCLRWWKTAAGIDAVRTIAHAPQVRRLAFGSIDLQLDLGIEGDDDALLYFRSELVLASRLADLPAPVDGVCTAIDDARALAAHVQRARRIGFGAVLCIHPAQVAPVNAGFGPTAEQLEWRCGDNAGQRKPTAPRWPWWQDGRSPGAGAAQRIIDAAADASRGSSDSFQAVKRSRRAH